MTDRPRVFVTRVIPDEGLDPVREAAATSTCGRTSCRRRATSCCGGSPAWTAC